MKGSVYCIPGSHYMGLPPLWDSILNFTQDVVYWYNSTNTSCTKQSIKTVYENSIFGTGPKLFNALPPFIREISDDFIQFKTVLDIFLTQIPDCPIIVGYNSHNLDHNGKPSNSLIHWIKNLNLSTWNNTGFHQESEDILV